MSVERRSMNNGEAAKSKSSKESECYFCNEMFEMGRLQNHLKQCGSILEQCPLRCGAWIQRKHKETHVKECPKMEKRSSTSATHARLSDPAPPSLADHTWTPKPDPLKDCVAFLEKEVEMIKLVLAEETNQRDIQSSELDAIRAKLLLLEEGSQHLLSTVVTLREATDDEAERAANWTAQIKHDLANIQIALQELQSQQLSTAMRLESAVSSLVHEQNERELLEQALTTHDTRIRAVHRLEEVIGDIRQMVEEERQRNEQSRLALEAELVEARRSSQDLANLQHLRVQLQHAAIPEAPTIDRLAVLEVETANVKAESSEQASRMETIARDLRALTKSYLKLRSELADFQARVSFDSSGMGSDDGHLIWRIENFTARIKEAREHDTVLCSPIFRTSKYGYTLKAELNLNGIGKWRGRNMTCTVRLVTGAYDALLAWPCDLQINIVLRDQPANRSQAMDIVKSLQIRRKSPTIGDYDTDERTKSTENLDKSVVQLKRQYIFIPHTSLDKFEYVKNDVMFLEFINQ